MYKNSKEIDDYSLTLKLQTSFQINILNEKG